MIKVNIKKENGVIIRIKINGHAEYNEKGKDIVCAGISAVLITSVNAILKFDETAIKFNESNDFYLENIKQDEITNKLLNNLCDMLKSFEKQYSKNIIIKED